jgi:hypothetical protein
VDQELGSIADNGPECAARLWDRDGAQTDNVGAQDQVKGARLKKRGGRYKTNVNCAQRKLAATNSTAKLAAARWRKVCVLADRQAL